MKRPILTLLLLGVLLAGVYPGFAQILASAQPQQGRETQTKPAQKKLKDVLKELKDHYRVDILFFDRNVEGFSIGANAVRFNLKLEQNLDAILKPNGLNYKKSKNGGYVIISQKEKKAEKPEAGFSEETVTPQPQSLRADEDRDIPVLERAFEQTVSGKVTDDEKKEGLPGVNVILKGTTKGVTTNTDGSFSISVPDGKAVLVFSFIGYEPQEVTVGNQTFINISLKSDLKVLSEVVVVGYGTQKKKDLTGAVTRVDPKLNETNPNVNVVQNLRGSVAGVRVVDTGRPGADGTISIRGNNSISANTAPLIILDGIIYTGGLSDISSNNIESIDILKDASSASIYGSRATNGVILITTKKGTSNKPRLNYNTYYGFSDFARTPKMMGPEKYLEMKKDAAAYLGRPLTLNVIEEANLAAGRTIDPWQAISQDAPMSNHEISLSGRTEKVNYYLSGSYTDMKGRIMGDNFSRFSSRLNLDVAVTGWLNVGTNTGYNFKDYSGVRALWGNASYLSPYSSIFYEDGALKQLPMDDGLAPNPVFATLRNDNLNTSNTLFSNIYADVALPLPGLSYRINVGNNLRFNEEANYAPSVSEPRDNNFVLGSGSKGHRKHHYFTIENIVKYQKVFKKDHAFDLTLLQSFEITKESASSLSSNNIFNDALSYNGLGIGENQLITSSATETKANSYMGRVGYKLKDRYMLNFTIRRDGFSAFGSGRKYGNFPSAGIGWLISEEGFISDLRNITYLKLRYSYGKNGNRGISAYSSLSNMSQVDNQYVFGDNGSTSIGITPTTMANSFLGWETTVASNIGLDFGILKDRISGSLEYYSMHTSDLLLSLRIPNMTGYESFFTNIGATTNKGLELTLNSTNFTKGRFTWSSNLVFSFNRNKIAKLSGIDLNGDGKEDDDIASKRFIGYPQGTNFDYVWDGIWQTGDDISIDPSAKPGFIRFKDVDGDGKITPSDRQVLHSSQPDFLTGLTNRLSYGNFSFSFLLNAVVGGYSSNGLLNHGTNFFDRTNLMDLPYWTPENPLTDRPSIGYPNPLGYGFYQSRTFMRLQDVSLVYEFPKMLLSKAKINNLRMYISGKNLQTWTKWAGWDPEHGSGGRDATNGPLLKSWVIGLDLGL